ncbi:MAG TPA: hypothetical protein PKW21_15370, partial [Rhabdaerophilum sp.]|nr:hypothetical protein [Rhabdaerophilum sp.]
GRSAERKDERRRIEAYRQTVEKLLSGLTLDNLPVASEIAGLPQTIKGYGPIRAANAAKADAREGELLRAFEGAGAGKIAVAAE